MEFSFAFLEVLDFFMLLLPFLLYRLLMMWIRVVVCRKLVKALAPAPQKHARMLKCTQLSENLHFHSGPKTKLMELFIAMGCFILDLL